MTPADNPILSPVGERPPDAVRRIAAAYGMSERNARRYYNRGEVPPPPESCRVGMDGKRYRCDPRRPRFMSPLHKPLAIARSNVRRAARSDTFTDGDAALVRDIVLEARRLLAGWEAVTGGDKSHLSERGKE